MPQPGRLCLLNCRNLELQTLEEPPPLSWLHFLPRRCLLLLQHVPALALSRSARSWLIPDPYPAGLLPASLCCAASREGRRAGEDRVPESLSRKAGLRTLSCTQPLFLLHLAMEEVSEGQEMCPGRSSPGSPAVCTGVGERRKAVPGRSAQFQRKEALATTRSPEEARQTWQPLAGQIQVVLLNWQPGSAAQANEFCRIHSQRPGSLQAGLRWPGVQLIWQSIRPLEPSQY